MKKMIKINSTQIYIRGHFTNPPNLYPKYSINSKIHKYNISKINLSINPFNKTYTLLTKPTPLSFSLYLTNEINLYQ